MKRLQFLIIAISFLINVILVAQHKSDKSNIFDPSHLIKRPTGLLDQLFHSSKFSMDHSYSISFFNNGNQGLNQGLYLNTMNYQISDPLLMQLRVGYLHQPFGGPSMSENSSGKVFVQRAMLQYKPMNNMTLRLDYQSYPSPLMNPYYRSW